jgi:hypothetical protein
MLIYRDGALRLQVRMDGQTAWLTQAGMAELFQTSVPNVNIHIRNILEEKELEQDSVIKEYLITAADGKNYQTKCYNLDMILAVGYRVRSPRGTQFRGLSTTKSTKNTKMFLAKRQRFFNWRLGAIAGFSRRSAWRRHLDRRARIGFHPDNIVARRGFGRVRRCGRTCNRKHVLDRSV